MSDETNEQDLKRTALHAFHVAHGAKMVPFAGYDMPVQYPMGVMKEHLHCRASAGLFDVSHMGQAFLIAEDGTFETAAKFLETLVPADVQSLKPGRQRYSQFLNDEGGILDDLMISRLAMPGHTHWIYIVVNAGCKDADYAHIEKQLPEGITLRVPDGLSLVALQGPKAAEVMARYLPDAATMKFMSSVDTPIDMDGEELWCHISRSGYTGEDGYELSIKSDKIVAFCESLLKHDEVELIGLGARDSLRLEAGLCLYGHDIDTTTSPVEAGLTWSIQKNRRKTGGFPGADRIMRELDSKPKRRRVGIEPMGRAPAREGTVIQTNNDTKIGTITSGGYGPSVEGPIAMGYVDEHFSIPGTNVQLIVRGKEMPAKIVKLPFVPNNFYRG
ncbi:MAG: glycine cleavage system aminomethyltransferase GcvT [Acidimicrobiales bacterium]|nr:glycine cleavage system aminomethyltransferase GcvT [Hyphomonadaceae bacterium]RZV39631.1 MAG: glycine cleavage system aminomethyltransferase GcvT [Acidimicrobiales bacterium]